MHGFVVALLNRPDIARACLHAAEQVADAMNNARIEALCVRLDPANAILPSEQILTGIEIPKYQYVVVDFGMFSEMW